MSEDSSQENEIGSNWVRWCLLFPVRFRQSSSLFGMFLWDLGGAGVKKFKRLIEMKLFHGILSLLPFS